MSAAAAAAAAAAARTVLCCRHSETHVGARIVVLTVVIHNAAFQVLGDTCQTQEQHMSHTGAAHVTPVLSAGGNGT